MRDPDESDDLRRSLPGDSDNAAATPAVHRWLTAPPALAATFIYIPPAAPLAAVR